MFTVQPAIANNGTLTFTLADGQSGNATVTVVAQDSGGTANGGVDRATNTFTLSVTPPNSAPSFALPAGPPGFIVNTLAGSGVAGSASGTGIAAQFNNPGGVAVDSAGNVYVADLSNHRIRKVTPLGVVTTLAGSGFSGFADGTGTAAQFNTPHGVAVDSAGNVYVADRNNQRIRKVTPTGVVTTLAGSTYGSADGTGTAAQFRSPTGVAVDSAGDVYVADSENNCIRKVTPAGVVTTLAGSTIGFADGTGTAAQFNGPIGVALDSAGNVYVADRNNNYIRKVTPTGVVTTLAGSGVSGFADGTGTAAQFNLPFGVAVDSAGNVYVVDRNNHRIRTVTPTGVVTTLAGSTIGFADGTDTAAQFNNPFGVAVDSAGNVYVADTFNHRIRKVTPGAGGPYTLTLNEDSGAYAAGANFAGSISPGPSADAGQTLAFTVTNDATALFSVQPTLAANGTLTFTQAPNANGTATVTVFAVDNGGTANGGVDTSAAQTFVIAITPVNDAPGFTLAAATVTVNQNSGLTTTNNFATGFTPGSANESAQTLVGYTVTNNNAALFITPPAITNNGTLTFALANGQTGNATVTVVARDSGGTANGGVDQSTSTFTLSVVTPPNTAPSFALPTRSIVSTLAGSSNGFADGTGTDAQFFDPIGVAVDSAGNVYVGDERNHRIRKVTPAGVVTTLAGSGSPGFADGTGAAAQFDSPAGVAVDSADNVYVSDLGNHRIRKVTPAGVVTTLAGSGSSGFADGTGTAVQFNGPTGVALDSADNVYVADRDNHRIRKVTPAGVVTTLAGSSLPGPADGTGTDAQFYFPSGVAADSAGNVYVADLANHRIRKVTPLGVVTTLAGSGVSGFAAGTGTDARFSLPTFVAVDSAGNVYVTDRNNQRIRKVTPLGVVTTLAGSTIGFADGTGTAAQFTNPFGVAVDNAGSVYVADRTNNRIRKITPIIGPYTLTVNEDSGAYAAGANFAGSISPGPSADAAQTLAFTVTNDATALFSVQPTLAADGTLTFTPAPNANGTATVTVFAVDNGGTAKGGVDTSAAQTFVIAITPVNSAPGFTLAAATVTVDQNSGLTTTNNFATGFTPGPANESAQTLVGYTVTNTNAALFTTPPAIANNGTLTFTLADGQSGNATVTVVAQDSGGTANGGVDRATNTFTLSVTPPNSAPSFALPAGPPGFIVNTLAGSGVAGSASGTGIAAQFNNPGGVAVDSAGNVYVADLSNHRIRKVTPLGVVTTLAGSGFSGFADGTGTAAQFNTPHGVAVDSAGNVYVADRNNQRIRKVTPTGVVTTLAGSTYGSADGTGTAAQFRSPTGVAVDSAGDVYVADSENNCIRKVTPAGVVTTLAGSTIGFADGTGTAAQFNGPIGVALDSAGNVYVADRNNNYIRKVTPTGVVTTLAGSGVSGFADGTGTAAQFNLPFGVAVDSAGNVYVVDRNNHRIRTVTPTGVVTTLAGSTIGFADGTDTAAQFNNPFGVAVDSAGNVYVADTFNHRIRKVTPGAGGPYTLTLNEDSGAYAAGANFAGSISPGPSADAGQTLAFTVTNDATALFSVQPTLAANGTLTFTQAPNANGTATVTVFAVDNGGTANGGVDTSAAQTFVIAITPVNDAPGFTLAAATVTVNQNSGLTTTNNFATGFTPGSANESAQTLVGYTVTNNNAALFITPPAITNNGTLTFALANGQTGNATVTVVARDSGGTANGGVDQSTSTFTLSVVTPPNTAPSFALPTRSIVSTLAGSSNGFADGTGTDAQFFDPIGVAVDSAGNVYVGDERNHRIRKVTPAGVVTTLAGSGSPGFADGTGAAAQFDSPAGVAVDSADNVYVSDLGNHRIRKVTPAGVVTTLAGSGSSGFADGTGTAVQFNGPTGVALDSADNVYVADRDNHRIRKVTPAGVVTTLAGSSLPGPADGTGTDAQFYFPSGVAADSAGNVYVADLANHRIRKVTPLGVVTTLAGSGVSGFAAGTGTDARFSLPTFVAVDSAGNVYVTDRNNQRIRKVTPLGVVTTLAGSTIGFADGTGTAAQFTNPFGVAVDNAGSVYVADRTNNRIRKITPIIGPYTLTVNEDSGAYAAGANFAGSISPGPSADAAQTLAFTVTNDATALFSVQPTLAADGTLTFTPAPNANGTATVTVFAVDNGGTAKGGVDTSAAQTFVIAITPVDETLTAIQSWRQQHFGSSENSGNAADLATPDGDGISNLVKYALNITPGSSGASGLPKPEWTEVAGSRYLALSVTRDPARNDVILDIEAGSDLDDWTVVGRSVNGAAFSGSGVVSETDASGGRKLAVIRDTVDATTTPRRFLRVKVSSN